jgi:hypothetical protein
MGILDKAKEVAKQGADAAKKAADAAKDKADEVQTKRKADQLAEQLGYLIVRERSEGADVKVEADALVVQIVDLQKQLAEAAPDTSDGSTPDGNSMGEVGGE